MDAEQINATYPTLLCAYADKWGSDKSPTRKHHSYTPYYYSLLKGIRHSAGDVLEVGIGHPDNMASHGVARADYKAGASLRMWRDFFPNARIHGADIDARCMFSEDHISTYLCDQSTGEGVGQLVRQLGDTRFDLIIDDGSHQTPHQIITLFELFPLLKPGGLYIIEDVCEPHMLDDTGRASTLVPQAKIAALLDSLASCGATRLDGAAFGYTNNVNDNFLTFQKKA
jgi:hypothetical protein